MRNFPTHQDTTENIVLTESRRIMKEMKNAKLENDDFLIRKC